MDDCCAVCTEPLEWVAYGPCNHREVCSTCVIRLRFICNEQRCCICKTESDKVFVTKSLGDYTKSISDFSILDKNNPQFWFHEETGAYFDDFEHLDKVIIPMCRLSCGVCEKQGGKYESGTILELKNHLFHKHKKIMCVLCLEGRKSFVCEQKLYTRVQLDRHILTGDSEVDGDEMERGGFKGHPECVFCKKRYYSDAELYLHMATQHFTCHICTRLYPEEQPSYYRNYDELEVHFGGEHFLCEDKECLEKKYVVFASKTELKRHAVVMHGPNLSKGKRYPAFQVPTDFQYLRSNEQGGSSSRRHEEGDRRDSDGRDHSPLSSVHPVSDSDTYGYNFEVSPPPLEEEFFPPLLGVSPNNPTNVQHRIQNRTRVPLSESFPPLPGSSANNTRTVQTPSQNTRSNQSLFPTISPASTSKTRKPKSSLSSQNRMATTPLQINSDATRNVPDSANSRPAIVESFPPLSGISTNSLVGEVGQNSWSSLVDQSPSPQIPVASTSKSRKNSGLSKSRKNSHQQENTMNVSSSANSELETTTGIASSSSASPADHGLLSPSISPSSQFKEVVTKNARARAIQAAKTSAAIPASSSKVSHNSLSFHNLAEGGESMDSSMVDFPPIHVPKKSEPPASSELKLGDSKTASDYIWESIQKAMESDENKCTSFRELCAEFREGVICADEYLAHVKQLGLSHLVLDLARLFPDVKMQRDLLKTYNNSLRSDSALENGLSLSAKQSKGSEKSKAKTVEAADIGSTSSNGGGSSKQEKKNSKSHKLQLVQLAKSGGSSSSTSSTARVKGHSGSLESSVSDFPPIPVPKKNESRASSELKLRDTQTASDSIWEAIRNAIEFDENKCTSFRERCAEFREGVIGADEYLAYVKQFGLSHLVLDLARLFPDVKVQRDLLKTYNKSLRSDSVLENGLSLSAKQSKGSDKSKAKTMEAADIGSSTSSNGGGSGKQQKNSKSHKLQLVQSAKTGGSSPSTSGTAKVKGQSGSLESSVSDFPPIPVPKKTELPASTESKVDDAQKTHVSLWDNIRSSLEFDENKYSAFRDISEEYKQGEIDAGVYLSYIQQFGLTHLVLELSRLFSDPHMQKDLLSTYNASVRSVNNAENSFSISDRPSKESSSSKKGKAKSADKKKPNLHKLPLVPIAGSVSSSSTTSTSQLNRHTEERKGPIEDFPPIPVVKKEPPQSTEPEVVDVYSANSTLVEIIRSTLEYDESKYTVFKVLTEEYGQGMTGAGEYLSYIEQIGLSHLVLDLARLCTDPWKQRELLDTYNASVRSDRESNALAASSSSSKSKAKQVKKKTSKVERMHLGNGGGQKLAALS